MYLRRDLGLLRAARDVFTPIQSPAVADVLQRLLSFGDGLAHSVFGGTFTFRSGSDTPTRPHA